MDEAQLPDHALFPSEDGWFSAPSGDRDTVMAVLMDTFPANTQPYLQQVMYSVMESANKMASVHGNKQEAWDYWAEQMVLKAEKAAEETCALVPCSEETLGEVAVGSGLNWDGEEEMESQEDGSDAE